MKTFFGENGEVASFTVSNQADFYSVCELFRDEIYPIETDEEGRMILKLPGEIGTLAFYEFDELYGKYESQNGFYMNVYAVPQDAELPDLENEVYLYDYAYGF